MYQSILIPVDGSTFSEQALPTVEMLARHANAVVHLVQVHVPIITTDVEGLPINDLDPQADADARDRELVYLEQLRRRVTSSGALNVSTTLLDAPVVPALIAYQHAHNVDLTVMTTHGRGGFARFWLGSTADMIVRESVIPVLLQRPDESQPGLRQPVAFKHILIPLDGSAEAEAILERVVAFGTLMDSTYTLLRVAEPFMLLGYDPVLYVGDAGIKAEAEQEYVAAAYLEQVADRLHRQGVQGRVQTRVVYAQQAASAILQDAREHALDAIAMATHGRHGPSRLLLGSTADKVIRGTHLPVLVFHPRLTEERLHDV
ncbi:MAG: universal stress protein [Herpetosiphonaceae bacterium]|nr:universal stress protein [Herpetosiphonaceae bacterium]